MYHIYFEKETAKNVYIGGIDVEEEKLHETLESLITDGYYITKIISL